MLVAAQGNGACRHIPVRHGNAAFGDGVVAPEGACCRAAVHIGHGQVSKKVYRRSAEGGWGDYLNNAQKLVVFAHHKATSDALEKAFFSYVRVDGSTPSYKSQAAIDKFHNDPACALFIGNLQAPGVGITLTAASATMTLEPGWVPGENLQAEDRVHRIGQEADSVCACYLVARGIIDEDIMRTLDKKTGPCQNRERKGDRRD